MSLNRYNPKRDANEHEIINAWLSHGATVWPMSGTGLPDLLVGFNHKWLVVEVKGPTGRLTAPQENFFHVARLYKLPAYVCRTVADVARVIKELEK